ncbi:RagB/SusD family nutrient uptake outer membrane protein [Chryseosolibacter indicus]|uniref:RagB/SusD family nutrient uptake outer membrane protein n=1 Tax=Chryseosolibacter indicus TaxID=2782351 RepID=A0ABS5VM34_9BACT|nr:RagB/SusD family nutrient uptake outer membrane protein [Chryseosolibacter indicus]MBT1702176.1 RagB/SusD family nutrient uptake outer membrane protein [Chryseosolibacter indicus]
MKTYKIFAALSLVTAMSCSDDFLEREPLTQKAVETFYATPQDALEGLVAAYDVLQSGDYGHILMVSEIASDNTFGGAGKSDGFGQNYWDWFRSENDLNANAWAKYYRGIYRANVILANLEKVQWGSQQSLKTRYESEARFLRAFFYFDLVRMFGNVPLITAPLEPGEYEQPQATPEQVYKQIAEDLKFAADNLPATPFTSIPSTEYGRVTKWAAESLLARVFLYYTGYYEKSDIEGVLTRAQILTYVDDVVNNSGHDLVPEFRRLWRAASWIDKDYVGEDNIETVFAIKYTFKGLNNWNLNSGNRWQKFLGLRNQNIYPYGGGWGFCTVTPELWNAYDANDTRRTATIIDIKTETPEFDAGDQRQYSGYAPKKYAPTSDLVMKDGAEVVQPTVVTMGGNDQIDWFDDWVIIRFSDVLLMQAELRLAEGGDALTPLQRVRDRAFAGSAPSVAVTKASIMEERRLEFALEGIRYWDLLRQGMDVAKAAIDRDDAVEELRVTFRPETKGLFKIPETQINLSNKKMNQNPGWEGF